jgi:hypothetical protein
MSEETTTTMTPELGTVMETVTANATELKQTMGAVRVSFSWVGTQRKLSDAQSSRIATTFEANTELVTASKKLFDTKNTTYRVLTAIKSQVWAYWRQMTLPFPQPGIRLIRQDDVPAFEERMRQFKTELSRAAVNLQLEYESIKTAAREKLGQLYNENDYPATLENVFALEWEYPSVYAPSYLMTFNPGLYEQEQRRIQQRFEQAVIMAEEAYAEQLRELVDHLIERLTDSPTGEKKIFKTSAVEHFQTFQEAFKRMNVRSNRDLETLIDRASGLVSGVDPKELRNSSTLRNTIKTQMADVRSALDELMTNAPSRRIIVD